MYGRCGTWWRGAVATPFIGGAFPWGRSGRWGRFFGSGELRLALLSMLESGPKHGYELMKELETKSGGIYKASAGAIYPALQQLEDEGMVTSETLGGKRTYSLTETGKAELQKEAANKKTAEQIAQEELDTLNSFEEFQLKVNSSKKQKAVFKHLQTLFQTNEKYAATVDPKFVELVLLLNID